MLYKRLASCTDDASIEEIRKELVDRFGLLPPEVSNLLTISEFKNVLRQLFVTRIDYNGREIIITFHEQIKDSLDMVLKVIDCDPKRFRLSPDFKLAITYKGHNWIEVIEEVRRLLHPQG